jgi:hypothetical protein
MPAQTHEYENQLCSGGFLNGAGGAGAGSTIVTHISEQLIRLMAGLDSGIYKLPSWPEVQTPKSQNIKENAVTPPPKPFYVLIVHAIAGYDKRPSPFNEYFRFW